KRQDSFARFFHRLDVVLESLRGNDRAELAICIYDYPNSISYRNPTDAGNKCGRMSSYRADANRVALVTNASVADIDIVITFCEILTRSKAHCNVVAAGGVAKERICTIGRVVAAGCV